MAVLCCRVFSSSTAILPRASASSALLQLPCTFQHSLHKQFHFLLLREHISTLSQTIFKSFFFGAERSLSDPNRLGNLIESAMEEK
jgi:hypothetical protein